MRDLGIYDVPFPREFEIIMRWVDSIEGPGLPLDREKGRTIRFWDGLDSNTSVAHAKTLVHSTAQIHELLPVPPAWNIRVGWKTGTGPKPGASCWLVYCSAESAENRASAANAGEADGDEADGDEEVIVGEASDEASNPSAANATTADFHGYRTSPPLEQQPEDQQAGQPGPSGQQSGQQSEEQPEEQPEPAPPHPLAGLEFGKSKKNSRVDKRRRWTWRYVVFDQTTALCKWFDSTIELLYWYISESGLPLWSIPPYPDTKPPGCRVLRKRSWDVVKRWHDIDKPLYRHRQLLPDGQPVSSPQVGEAPNPLQPIVILTPPTPLVGHHPSGQPQRHSVDVTGTSVFDSMYEPLPGTQSSESEESKGKRVADSTSGAEARETGNMESMREPQTESGSKSCSGKGKQVAEHEHPPGWVGLGIRQNPPDGPREDEGEPAS